ncbi:hypothetical protein [Desulfosarcina cetonica]|uniref:hypothetical protein n=1 Tax=Desulfosarcina cetonica TaxID=90730 RepID=UPI0006CF92D4|nr:hypothetical protein [Desulfosarcina cetonica]
MHFFTDRFVPGVRLTATPCRAQGMRTLQRRAQEARQALEQKAAAERDAARQASARILEKSAMTKPPWFVWLPT